MSTHKDVRTYKIHESMRGYFGYALYSHMLQDERIVLLVGDLGYKMFDAHFEDFPDRCINCGASEQAMLGIACGLALSGKIPVVYSITPFLLYRGFETIRNYIDHEELNVKLIGSGRDKDYAHDGFSHDASDVQPILDTFEYITQHYPQTKEEIPALLRKVLVHNEADFISLTR